MSTNGHNGNGHAPKARAPKGGLRVGGKTIPAGGFVPLRYSRIRPDGDVQHDPANGIPLAPPNFGRPPVPHVLTFQGIISTVAQVYRNPDAAMRHSKENALVMRQDCSIMGPLEARKRATALLNWHLEPEDAKNAGQKDLADKLTAIVKEIPYFTRYRQTLLEALWFGRYGMEHCYGFDYRTGKKRTVITQAIPIHGDKLVFRYDDGSGKHDPNQIGIRMLYYKNKDIIAGDRKLEPTEAGMAYFLEPWEREQVAVHRHEVEDAAFEDPLSAGSIHGLGIRSKIYWTWFQMSEAMAMLMDFLQRSGQGIWIYFYPSGNEQAKADVEAAAKGMTNDNIIVMPCTPGEPGMDPYRIERIEVSPSGAEQLRTIIHDLLWRRIVRYVLGQTLSSEAEATGLGSGVADLQKGSLLSIVKYDATNLEETLTRELVLPLKNYNFPSARDITIRFKIDTESDDAQKKLAAAHEAWEMGARIKESDILDEIGFSAPTDEDVVLQNPTIRQQQRLWEQQHGAQVQGSGQMPGDQQATDQAPSDPSQMSVEDLFGPLAEPAIPDQKQYAKRGRPSRYRQEESSLEGVPADANGQHQVGDTKVGPNGVEYTLSENHRWTLANKEQGGGEGEKGEQQDDGGDQPKQPKPWRDPQGLAKRQQMARDNLGKVDNQVGGLMRSFQASPDFEKGGEYWTKDLHPEVSKQSYAWLKQNVGKVAGGGVIVDLGEGRLGFSSNAGAVVLTPDGKATYTVNTRLMHATGLLPKNQEQSEIPSRAGGTSGAATADAAGAIKPPEKKNGSPISTSEVAPPSLSQGPGPAIPRQPTKEALAQSQDASAAQKQEAHAPPPVPKMPEHGQPITKTWRDSLPESVRRKLPPTIDELAAQVANAPSPEPPPARQPHEMTRDEFRQAGGREHKAHIKKALAEGKAISAGVLKDYPEIVRSIASGRKPSGRDETAAVAQASGNKPEARNSTEPATDQIDAGKLRETATIAKQRLNRAVNVHSKLVREGGDPKAITAAAKKVRDLRSQHHEANRSATDAEKEAAGRAKNISVSAGGSVAGGQKEPHAVGGAFSNDEIAKLKAIGFTDENISQMNPATKNKALRPAPSPHAMRIQKIEGREGLGNRMATAGLQATDEHQAMIRKAIDAGHIETPQELTRVLNTAKRLIGRTGKTNPTPGEQTEALQTALRRKVNRASNDNRPESQIFDEAGEEYALDPRELADAAKEIVRQKSQDAGEMAAAYKEAVKRTGLNARTANHLEDKGGDSSKLDEGLARELAKQYPALGWGAPSDEEDIGGAGKDSTDYAAKLLDFLKAGPPTMPRATDEDVLREAAKELSRNLGKREREPGEDEEPPGGDRGGMESVPFAKHKPAKGQGSIHWEESEHPRGQPENAGAFVKKEEGQQGGFSLSNEPAKEKADEFGGNDNTKQRKLLSGLDALPGQMDLVSDVDTYREAEYNSPKEPDNDRETKAATSIAATGSDSGATALSRGGSQIPERRGVDAADGGRLLRSGNDGGPVDGGGDRGSDREESAERKPVEHRLVTAREQFTRRANPEVISPGCRVHLDEHQQQGAAAAIEHLDAVGGFLLADGTGAGKTRQQLAVAKTYADRGNSVLIVTKAEVIKPDWKKGVISGSFEADGKTMDVNPQLTKGDTPLANGSVYITTYDRLKDVSDKVGGNTIVLYDEAHAMKNSESARSELGHDISDRAKAVMYSTATPADKPTHLDYLFRAGVFEGKSKSDVYHSLGMHLKEIRTRSFTRKVWAIDPRVGADEVYRRIGGLFDRLTQRGGMLKREISMDGVPVNFHKIELPAEAHKMLGDIERELRGTMPNAGLEKSLIRMHQRRQQEPYKVPHAVSMVKKALADGKQAVVFASRVNDSAVKLKGSEAKIAESQGTMKLLREALAKEGITDIAELHGGSKTKAPEAMQQFQSGKNRVMLATIESGGTGINLDDTEGDKPRSLIMMTAPFSAVENVQAAGRIWRLKTKSHPEIHYLFANTDTDDWNSALIAGKMKSLKATVKGEIGKLMDGEEDEDDTADRIASGYGLPQPISPSHPAAEPQAHEPPIIAPAQHSDPIRSLIHERAGSRQPIKLSGNTFKHKDDIKRWPVRWNSADKVWEIQTHQVPEESHDKLAAAIRQWNKLGVRHYQKRRGESPISVALSQAADKLARAGLLERYAKWDESKHPRGQPDNKGEFGPGGGGNTAGRQRQKKTDQAGSQEFKKWFGDK